MSTPSRQNSPDATRAPAPAAGGPGGPEAFLDRLRDRDPQVRLNAAVRLAYLAGARWPDDRTPRLVNHSLFPPTLRVPRPGGGLFASALDLVAFGRMCLRLLRGGETAGAPLTRAGLAAMLAHQTAGVPVADPKAEGRSARGLGWELPGLDAGGPDAWSPSTFGHTGDTGTGFRVDPERDLVVVFLTGRSGSLGPDRLMERVLHAAAAAGRAE